MMSFDELKAQLDQAGVDTGTLQNLAEIIRQTDEKYNQEPAPNVADAESIIFMRTTLRESLDLWLQLRRLTPDTGYYPAILGAAHWHDYKIGRDTVHTSQILDQASTIDGKTWLLDKWNSIYNYDDEDRTRFDNDMQKPLPDYIRSNEVEMLPYLGREIYTGKIDLIDFGLIPTQFSWEVPAYLHYGNWHACPTPQEHVAVQKYWYETYGAEIVVASADTIECIVNHPPSTRETALLLTQQHIPYCYDLLENVFGVGEIAARLINGRSWRFWWD